MKERNLSNMNIIRMSVPNSNRRPSIKKLQENVISFPFSAYPFPNQQIKASQFITTLQCSLTQDKIYRIVNLDCENIIKIQKVAKIKARQKDTFFNSDKNMIKNEISQFIFYYQKVQYSLEEVLTEKSNLNNLKLPKFNLGRSYIKRILASTIATLLKQKIIAFIQFSQIGINLNGTLKIYIAPNVLFDQQQYNPKKKYLVLKYLNNVLKQIDLKFSKTLKNIHSSQNSIREEFCLDNYLIKNQESFNINQDVEDKAYQNHSNSQKNNQNNFFQKLQKSLNEQQQNFISVSGSTNLKHFKLQTEMKKKIQYHKLAEKAEQNIKTQKQSRIFTKQQQRKKINEISLQLQQIRKKIRIKAEEKRQQNPFNIKWYKTLVTEAPTNCNEFDSAILKNQNLIPNNQKIKILQVPKISHTKTKKRKSSQSSINFYQGIPPQNQKNINCVNIYHQQNNYNQSYYPGDDCMSVDTYEMQIGEDYEMPKINVAGGLRKTLVPNKSREQIHAKRRVPQRQDSQKNRFYQSAGGKRFNHIVSLLKPQFQPKKSNIYQEPEMQNEEQSKKSISMKKSLGSKLSDKQSIQKRRQAKSKLSSSQNNLQKQIKGLKTLEQFKSQLKNIMSIKQHPIRFDIQNKSMNYPKQRRKNPQVQFEEDEIRLKHKSSQKNSQIFRNKSTLEQKVRKAMQRTKKAIDVLNKAKAKQINLPYNYGVSI